MKSKVTEIRLRSLNQYWKKRWKFWMIHKHYTKCFKNSTSRHATTKWLSKMNLRMQSKVKEKAKKNVENPVLIQEVGMLASSILCKMLMNLNSLLHRLSTIKSSRYFRMRVQLMIDHQGPYLLWSINQKGTEFGILVNHLIQSKSHLPLVI